MANIRFDNGAEVTAPDLERIPGLTDPEGAREDGWMTPRRIRRAIVTTIGHASAGTLTIDCSQGDYFLVNLQAAATLAFSNVPPAASVTIHFVQDGTGGRVVTLPGAAKAIVGSDTAIQPSANARTVSHWTTLNAGSRWDYSMKGTAA
ncbi:hypothetical protein CSC62_07585 [Pseudoxanthomonas jiangsuensis]|uniref:hypothetical protein n=1 Tax=Pseudoxanthomonas jiangsuensis TaxID=619688 RepID=UPI001390A7F6|nr:hypothetical protein [Pseudoxanthomonas jiangsuensis]KAF1697998.1 hypothetical protein CSC62_07585 [Pseudoxanthomonas jiangsuensis]